MTRMGIKWKRGETKPMSEKKKGTVPNRKRVSMTGIPPERSKFPRDSGGRRDELV